MMKAFSFGVLFFLLSQDIIAQAKPFTITIDEDEIKGGNINGYFHSPDNTIVINTQKKDSITHLFFDSAFNFLSEYKVDGADRRLLYAVFGSGHRKPFFIRNIAIQKTILEMYVSMNNIFIYKLDPETRTDSRISEINLKKKYKDEVLLAIMPNENGCNFLCTSQKKDVIVIHKWQYGNNLTFSTEIPFLESTLSTEEKKKWGGNFLELKNSQIFSLMSVSHVNKPDIFQFPLLSQLFYNDSCMYIVNALPNNMGTNIIAINSNKGTINSHNYIVNKQLSETDLNDIASPVATIYDSLLIIQNWSEKKFEYYFYNLINGNLIRKYHVQNGDSIYNFVHSPLRQYGTFGSASGEKQTGNERRFVRKMEHGIRFIKPMISNDSLVLTFGSFIPTKGVEGLMMGVLSIGGGLATGLATGNSSFFYYSPERTRFLFAHSKFSLQTLGPATENGLRTFLDDFITNKQMDELADDNAILIVKPDKLYIGMYKRKSRIISFTEFEQR